MDSHPIVIERGEGNYLIDTEGNRYLDGISSMWVNLHGHDHPKIRGAIHAQLDRLAHSTLLGLASVPSIEVAERLVGLAPEGLTRCFFSDNGSTAMEVALKLAFQYWQQRGDPDSVRRTRFVALRGAYHGDTDFLHLRCPQAHRPKILSKPTTRPLRFTTSRMARVTPGM